MYNTIAVSHKPTENFNKSGVLAKRLADELGASVTGLIVDDSGSKQAAVDRLAGLLPSEARPGAPQQAPRAAPPQSDLPFECKTLTGRAHKALAAELGAGSYDLLVVGGVDSATERLLRTSHIDTLVVKTADGPSS